MIQGRKINNESIVSRNRYVLFLIKTWINLPLVYRENVNQLTYSAYCRLDGETPWEQQLWPTKGITSPRKEKFVAMKSFAQPYWTSSLLFASSATTPCPPLYHIQFDLVPFLRWSKQRMKQILYKTYLLPKLTSPSHFKQIIEYLLTPNSPSWNSHPSQSLISSYCFGRVRLTVLAPYIELPSPAQYNDTTALVEPSLWKL